MATASPIQSQLSARAAQSGSRPEPGDPLRPPAGADSGPRHQRLLRKRLRGAPPCATFPGPAACRSRVCTTISSPRKSCFTSSRSIPLPRLWTGCASAWSEVTDPADRIRMFIRNHLEYFLANQKAMKVLSHEEDVLKNGFGAEIAAIKREYYRHLRWIAGQLTRRHVDWNSPVGPRCSSLFGMMNWIYTWYNPRMDAGAEEAGARDGRHFPAGHRHGIAPGPRKKRPQHRAESNS